MSHPKRMKPDSKVFVAGHRGLVGSALVRRLRAAGYENILTRSRSELDLLNQTEVEQFLSKERPDVVIVAAAKVGGIVANNTFRADFISQNLIIETNLIAGSHKADIERLLFLGSSCIYPRECPQPIRESYLLTGPLEPTNQPYAIAKIAGIELCNAFNDQYFRRYLSVMPTNLYGPFDNFDLTTSHVLPALIRRFHEATMNQAPSVTIWGSGTPRREFLYVDDLADACVYLLEQTDSVELVNVGTGTDLSILELARLVAKTVSFQGEIKLDRSKPDGTPRKLLDVSRLSALGWNASTQLEKGLALTYDWYLSQAPA